MCSSSTFSLLSFFCIDQVLQVEGFSGDYVYGRVCNIMCIERFSTDLHMIRLFCANRGEQVACATGGDAKTFIFFIRIYVLESPIGMISPDSP